MLQALKLTQPEEGHLLQALPGHLQHNSYSNEMKLCVSTLKGFVVLKLQDIIVCEAAKNYTVIHLQHAKRITVCRPLLEYEQLLAGAGFVRVHRTYIINLHHLQEYQRGNGGTVVMSNGVEIEVSRRRKDAFLEYIRGAFRC
jgi:two-component system LytT family response regulator